MIRLSPTFVRVLVSVTQLVFRRGVVSITALLNSIPHEIWTELEPRSVKLRFIAVLEECLQSRLPLALSWQKRFDGRIQNFR